MKALVKTARGPGNLELIDVPIPEPGSKDVLMKVWGSGICGTDIHIYHGEYDEVVPPLTLGHEFSATVAQVGHEVTQVKPGDRVVSDLITENGVMGNDTVNGAHAEYVVMPSNQVHKLPDAVSLREAVLIEPLVACQHSLLECVKPRPADFIAITGPGPIGCLMLQVARLFSPSAVLITGLRGVDDIRMDVARELGADYVLNNDEDVVSRVMELTGGKGADVVIECSGADQAINQALDMVKMGGIISNFAVYDNVMAKAKLSNITWKCLTVVGSWGWLGYPEQATRATAGAISWQRTLRILGMGKLKLAPILTHELPLEDWKKGFEICEKKQGVKVVLRP
jgi:L-iditol 2-dehydrogenase